MTVSIQLPRWLRVVLLTLLLASLGYSVFHSIMGWPKGDEADYLLHARYLAEGKLPYQDFHAIIPPLGQLITSGIIKLAGLNVPLVRSIILLGWVTQIVLLYRMAREFLPATWCWTLAAFLWLSDSRYLVNQHHFWSGMFALFAILQIWKYLTHRNTKNLFWGGIWMALVPWVTQSLGGVMVLATFGFSLLDRKNWRSTWGLCWLLPIVVVSALMISWLVLMGAWSGFLHDAVFWVFEGHYAKTTTVGYFPTLVSEIMVTLLPLYAAPAQSLEWFWRVLFLLRIPVAIHLGLIAILPIVGMVTGAWLVKVNWFTDEKLRWLWLALMSGVLIFSTFSYGTSMHLVSNFNVVMLLSWIGIYRLLGSKIQWSAMYRFLLIPLLALMHVAAIYGAWMQMTMGVWLAPMPTMQTSLLLPESSEQAVSLIRTIQLLEFMAGRHQPVLVLYESPDLYLATHAQNPTRYSIILPVYTSARQVQDIVTTLVKNPPAVMIDDSTLTALSRDPRFQSIPPEQLKIPEITKLMNHNYRHRLHFGNFHVYFRLDTEELK